MATGKFPDRHDLDHGIYIQYLENIRRTEKIHSHPFFQVFFLLRGRLFHQINHISAEMTVGEMAIIPPQVMHSVSLSGDASYYSLSFDLSSLGEINCINEQAINFLESLKNSSGSLFPKTTIADSDVLYVKNLFERMAAEFALRDTGYKETVIAGVILLMTQFIRRYFVQYPNTVSETCITGKHMVFHCIRYIDAHPSEAMSLEDMAKKACVSVGTFCSYFKQITGKSFHQYVNQRRIEYSNELIKKGYEITAVSDLCGFGDFSTFSRNYKKIMGVSPLAYRKVFSESSTRAEGEEKKN